MKLLISSLLCSLTFVILTGCQSFTTSTKTAIDFVPQQTTQVYAIDDISQIQKELQDNILTTKIGGIRLQKILAKNTFLTKLPFTSEILIALPEDSLPSKKVLVIVKQNLKNTISDSIVSKQKSTTSTKGIIEKKYGSQSVFETTQDGFILISPTKKVIQNALLAKKNENFLLRKLYKSNAHYGLSVYQKNNTLNTQKTAYSSWNVINTTLLSKGIQASGIAIMQDSLQLLSVFKGQKVQSNTLSNVIPTTTKHGRNINYSNAQLLYANLNSIKKDSIIKNVPEVFETITAIAQIKWNQSNVFILESLDTSLTLESVSSYISENEIYKDIMLYSFSDEMLIGQTFSPLLTPAKTNTLFVIDSYVFATNSSIAAKEFITELKTKEPLAAATYFKKANQHLSTDASLLLFEQEDVGGFTQRFLGSDPTQSNIKKFPIAIAQYNFDTAFAHINFICQEDTKETKTKGGVSQILELELANPIVGKPTFFTNHKTKEKEIVLQDNNNTLYLYDVNGIKKWSRTFENTILGATKEIDILRNGKKQLVFTTKNKLFVLDRNGKNVAPFPITFKDQITQPLAVFDYDNNKKYRFVITQGNEVVMLDSKGKTVKGFTFKKAKSTIIATPQHIRLQNKDYLLFQEENGTLNILSRTGKQRIKISEEIKFTGEPILKTRTSFIVITKDKVHKTISQSGKIKSKNIKTEGDYFVATLKNNTIVLTDNILRINNKVIELPFGIYTKPNVYYANKKGYVGLTETQEKKGYLYTFKGKLLEGFPVYGSTQPQLIAENRNILVLTQEDEKKLLLYRIN